MDKSRLCGNLDTGKDPFGRCFSLSGAEAQPSQNYSNTDAATCFAGMVVFCGLPMAQRKFSALKCSEYLRINILKGNIGRHLSWSARQQSDKALTSPQQRKGTRSN